MSIRLRSQRGRRIAALSSAALAVPAIFALSQRASAETTGSASPAVASARVVWQAWARSTSVSTFTATPGRLYISALGGSDESRSFVQLSREPPQPHTLLEVKPASDSIMGTGPQVIACPLTTPLHKNGELTGAQVPGVDCRTQVHAAPNTSGYLVVDLTAFARAWATHGETGIALITDPKAAGATYRLTLAASETRVQAGRPVSSEPSASPTAERPSTGGGSSGTTGLLGQGQTEAPTSTNSSGVTSGSGNALSDRAPVVAPSLTSSPPPALLGNATASGHTGGQSPPTMLLFGALIAGAAVVLFVSPLRRRVVLPTLGRVTLGTRGQPLPALGLVAYSGLALLAAVPLALGESIVFKAGLVVIFIVAACGLHLLVNWAGEFSLAHAELVGLPALIVLAISASHSISPIYLLPVGVVAGTATGAIVGLPTIRARGLQVAIITLSAGIAIDRFFFQQSWLVGDSSSRASAPVTLGPVTFTTSRSLYPVLVAVAVIALLALWRLLHSKMARGWFWIRVNPAAAAAFGIPVIRYRLLAYAASGAFAGLGGALTVMWVQDFGATSFPTTMSFTFLLVAVLAGLGYAGGLIAAAALIQGGTLFSSGASTLLSFAGPIALVLNLTRFPAGFNGIGRKLMERFGTPGSDRPATDDSLAPGFPLDETSSSRPRPVLDRPITLAAAGGTVAILAGFIAIGTAWYHTGNTNALWVQNQEILSGGIGGLALIIVGATLLIRDALSRRPVIVLRQQPDSDDTSQSPLTWTTRAETPNGTTKRHRAPAPRPLSDRSK
jgi:branched-chain amino acid transport system permease protein